jgi:hypothetical protein
VPQCGTFYLALSNWRGFLIIPVLVKSDEDGQIIWEESYQIVKQNLFATSDNNTEGNGKSFKM